MTILRHNIWRILAGALWLLATANGSAQSNPDDSARPPRKDDVIPKGRSPEEMLRNRLRDAREFDATEQLVRRLIKDMKLDLREDDKKSLAALVEKNPELAKRMARELLADPEFRKDLEKKFDKSKLSPQDQEVIRDVAGLKPKPPDPMPDPDGGMGPRPKKPSPQPLQPGNQERTAGGPSASREPPRSNEPDWLSRQVSKNASRFADLLDALGDGDDASFLRQMIRRMAASESWDWAANNGVLARTFGRLRELPLEQMASGDWSSVFNKFHLPDMPKFNFSFGGGSTSGGRSGAVGPRGTSSKAGVGTILVWLAILGLVLLVLWRKRELLGFQMSQRPGWHPGPWPVAPDQVRSRGDLIRAFEYLAYLVLGLSARPRNHLDLAASLAAYRLGRLYELARYAPPEETLPEEELRAARQDLASLAGVGRA